MGSALTTRRIKAGLRVRARVRVRVRVRVRARVRVKAWAAPSPRAASRRGANGSPPLPLDACPYP